jgi:hypothetical protein
MAAETSLLSRCLSALKTPWTPAYRAQQITF